MSLGNMVGGNDKLLIVIDYYCVSDVSFPTEIIV